MLLAYTGARRIDFSLLPCPGAAHDGAKAEAFKDKEATTGDGTHRVGIFVGQEVEGDTHAVDGKLPRRRHSERDEVRRAVFVVAIVVPEYVRP